MLSEWHYRILNQEFGPVPLDIIRELLRENQLCAEDLVKRTARGAWQRADTYPEIFLDVSLSNIDRENIDREHAPPLTDLSPEDICDILREGSRSFSDCNFSPRAGLKKPPMTTERGSQTGGAVPGENAAAGEVGSSSPIGVSSAPNACRAAGAAVSQDRTGRGTTWEKLRSARALWLVSSVCLVAAMVAILLVRNPNRRRYRMMVNIWNQTQQLQQRTASRSEWKAFVEQAQRQLNPVLRELQRAHSASGRHLLFAGRDLLETIRKNGEGKAAADATEDFQWQMARAEELLAGRPERDEAAVPTARSPDEKLEATTRLYLPMMLHGKTFTWGPFVWNANVDTISDIVVHEAGPLGDGWYEAVASLNCSDPGFGPPIRAKVKVAYHLDSAALGTGAGMQKIPYGRVTVLSIEPLEPSADIHHPTGG